MRYLLTAVSVLAASCVLFAGDAKYYLVNGVVTAEPSAAAPAASAVASVVPLGFHAHTKIDGTTIVHSDDNFGSASAHAGVALPWPKTAFAGQTIVSSCPGGVCPTPQSARSVSTTTASTAATSANLTQRLAFPRLQTVRSFFRDRPRLFSGRFLSALATRMNR